MSKKIIILFIVFLFIKQLVWVSLVPLWHFPDEQAHFAQGAFIAEKGIFPEGTLYDLTDEISISENLLGTQRDKSGNNRFTFHPEYRIPYSRDTAGIFEKEIASMAKKTEFRQMGKNEASHYPPLYYFFIALFYKILYFNDLFQRVFSARIFQLVFYLGTVFIAFRVARLLFGKNNKYIIPLGLLVSFHPMYSFVSSGVNSDNIANFIFGLFIYISLKIIKGVFNFKKLLEILLVSFLSFYIKPQFYITVPLIFLIILYKLFSSSSYKKRYKIGWLIFLLSLFLSLVSWALKSGRGAGIIVYKFMSVYSFKGLIEQFGFYAFEHAYREVLPWYWGIFNWLGVTYPRVVHRSINWIVLFSLIGLIIFLVKNIKKINHWPINGIIYLILVNIFFFFGVYLFDWIQFASSGYKFHLGVQGRYFFPLIISHMLFILIGWSELFHFFSKLADIGLKILVTLMLFLHWYAVFLVVQSYYDLSSLAIFVIQASQYKPWYFKGIFLITILILALTANLIILIKYLRRSVNYDQKNKIVF